MSRHQPFSEADQYIGERIREARIAAGLSQEDLAHMLGISYQQIQKYERGHNRISGLRMGRLMTALNRPFTYFIPNATDIRSIPALSAQLANKEGLRVAELWPRLSPARRALIVKLAEEFVA